MPYEDREDSRFLKKRVKFDSIDVHPIEKALVVFYEIHALAYAEDGTLLSSEKKECQKLIRLRSLDSSTDIVALSKEVLHQCKLIPSAKLVEVQQLLGYLQERPERDTSGKSRSSAHSADGGELTELFVQSKEQASLAKIDSYVELLYEDLNARNRGTALILQLAKDNENLEDLGKNDALLHAVCRVFREDARKHYSIAINITFIFLYFASYSQFHGLLTQFKVGSMIMTLVNWELQRYDQWQVDLSQIAAANQDEYQKKVRTVLLQQTLVLRTCFYILLHLAEDPVVEDKMRCKEVTSLLVRTLQRKHNHNSVHELLYLALTFLQKLSIFSENKNDMDRLGVIEKAAVLLDHPAAFVRDSAARVLYNLSFDPQLRIRMGRLGILPSLLRIMTEDEEGSNSGWALMYNISMDDRGRVLVARTECFAFVLGFLGRCKSEAGAAIPMALAINLATVPKLAEQLCKSQQFEQMLDRALSTQDAITLKLLRNAAKHSATSMDPNLAVKKIVEVLFQTPDEHFMAESLGLLANIGRFATVWNQLFSQHRLVNWVEQQLKPGSCAPDCQLGVVLLLGAAARDAESCKAYLDSEIITLLLNMLRVHQEDDEIVLQILYVFYNVCRHDNIRAVIINQYSDVPAYMMDLVTDQNFQVRQLCEAALDLVAESDATWREKILNERFCSHNAQWIEVVSKTRLSTPSLVEELESGESSMLGLCVQHADILERGSTSASSFGSPESRVASPVGSVDTWDSHYIDRP